MSAAHVANGKLTYRFEFRDGTTFRTRTIQGSTLGEAINIAQTSFPTWEIKNIWERQDLVKLGVVLL